MLPKNWSAMVNRATRSALLRALDMAVLSLKSKAANFDQATHVKAIGMMAGGEFRAQDLLIKCPSKYQDEPQQKAAVQRADGQLSGLGLAGVTLAVGFAAFAMIGRITRA